MNDPADAVIELVGFRQPVIPDSPVGVIARPVPWTPAKLSAHERIADSHALQRPWKNAMAEMRRVTAVWRRPNVRHLIDTVRLQQPQERLQRVVGVPDSEHGMLRCAHGRSPSGSDDCGNEFIRKALKRLAEAYRQEPLVINRDNATPQFLRSAFADRIGYAK